MEDSSNHNDFVMNGAAKATGRALSLQANCLLFTFINLDQALCVLL